MNAYSEKGDELECHFERELVLALGEDAWEQLKTSGAAMTLEEAIAVAQSLCEDPAQAVADS
jgi:hypothetical protein